jgi:hypothetical protein
MNHTDAKCPTQETLTAFLAATGDLAGDWPRSVPGDAEMQRLNEHVAACNDCIEELRAASYRLALANEIPVPVPAHIAAQTLPASQPRRRPEVTERAGVFAGLRDWLVASIRLPVLVPAAVAALALIVVVPRLQTPNESSEELSRAVELRQIARITVDSAAVYTEHDRASGVIMTLSRGDRAVLVGEQDDWYRVALADGSEGWIERRAFD